MTETENRLKMIPLLKEFVPVLEAEVRKWDGKVLNKKFYNAITNLTQKWYDKEMTIGIIQFVTIVMEKIGADTFLSI